jgi:hypothetical protein
MAQGTPTNQELFLQANAAYAAHDYTAACALYEKITNKGPVTWYNMGNCAYQLKRYSDAYLYWKKSEQGASWVLLQDAEHNCHLLRPVPSTSWYSHIQECARMIIIWSPFWWLQIVGMVLWILFLFLYLRRLLRPVQGMLLLLVCCCGIALNSKYSSMSTKVGIVKQPETPLYAGPNSQFHHIATLDALSEVRVVQQQAGELGWYKIAYQDQVGWIPADSVASV